ncbi:hypothetical protein ACLOAV_000565 [Pseudogymnoascus australis]
MEARVKETKRKAVAAAAAAEGPLDGQCIRRKELLKKKADYKSLFLDLNERLVQARENLGGAMQWYEDEK